jgi:formate dehydrogenase subunit delta
MDPANLTKMANQIGDFFEAMPDRDQAIRDVASHLQRFWEPRMRRALLEHVARSGDGELRPLVRGALQILRDSE